MAYNPPEKFLGHLANVNVACFVFVSCVQNTLASSLPKIYAPLFEQYWPKQKTAVAGE